MIPTDAQLAERRRANAERHRRERRRVAAKRPGNILKAQARLAELRALRGALRRGVDTAHSEPVGRFTRVPLTADQRRLFNKFVRCGVPALEARAAALSS